MMDFMFYEHPEGRPTMVVHGHLYKDDPLIQLGAEYAPPKSTSDKHLARQVQKWMHNCVHEHATCYANRDARYRPPRLLQLDADHARLVPGTKCPPGSPWVTLSHCWGGRPTFLTTTATNLARHEDMIPLEALPLTFRDAITFCLELNMDYIWIDSLCIIQSGEGSEADWSYHVAEMRNIYWNAHINISADRASSAEEGLFVHRDTETLKRTIIRFEKGLLIGSWTFGTDSTELMDHYWDSPLAQRGWVLQERVLSPRRVHFCQDQIRWQCTSAPYYMSERYPNGFEFGIHDSTFEPIKHMPSSCQPPTGEKAYNYHSAQDYFTSVNNYSLLSLTYDTYPVSDKLPAFAAIAEHYCRRYNDDYVAGFLKRHLPLALAWEVAANSHLPASSPMQMCHYNWPSWSWAKVDCGIGIGGSVTKWGLGRDFPEDVDAAELLHQYVELIDLKNKCGRIHHAELGLRARLSRCIWHKVPNADARVYMELSLQDGVVCRGSVKFDSVAEISIAEERVEVMLLSVKRHHTVDNIIHVLVLEKQEVFETPTYTRIGAGTLRSDNTTDLPCLILGLEQRDILLI